MIKKTFKIILSALYFSLVGVVLAVSLLFVGTKVDMLGYQVKVVQSGSMEPEIMTGGIVVIAPTTAYAVGDIVTYGNDTRTAVPVTHRIIENAGSEQAPRFITQGDANEDPDPAPIRDRDIIGKVAFTIPYLGFVIEFARTPLGFMLLIGIPALLVVFDELANIIWEVHKYRYRLRRQGKVGYRTPARQRPVRDRAITPKETQRPAQSPGMERPKKIEHRSARTPRVIPDTAIRTMPRDVAAGDFVLDLRMFKPYERV